MAGGGDKEGAGNTWPENATYVDPFYTQLAAMQNTVEVE